MGATLPFATAPIPDPVGEQRVLVSGMSWPRYLAISAMLDEHPGVRLTYLQGTLEITVTSVEHERIKKIIARLLEAYAVRRRVVLNGYGSATFKKEAAERGAEPDECYVLGSPLRQVPDIAVEVVVTSGGIDKLSVYAGLGVPEVWFFHDGEFYLYRRLNDGYEAIERSGFLPDLDLTQLAGFVDREDQTAAVIAFSDGLSD